MKLNQSISIHPGIKKSTLYVFSNVIILLVITWMWFIGALFVSTYSSSIYIDYGYGIFGLLLIYIQLLMSKILLSRQFHLNSIVSFGVGAICILIAYIVNMFFSYDGNTILIYYIFGIGLGSILLCECTKTRLQFTLLYILQIVGTVGLFLIIK